MACPGRDISSHSGLPSPGVAKYGVGVPADRGSVWATDRVSAVACLTAGLPNGGSSFTQQPRVPAYRGIVFCASAALSVFWHACWLYTIGIGARVNVGPAVLCGACDQNVLVIGGGY